LGRDSRYSACKSRNKPTFMSAWFFSMAEPSGDKSATSTRPRKSLHQMLSPKGSPSMDNLAAIFRAVQCVLQVSLTARSVMG